jgi:hypothetical protein
MATTGKWSFVVTNKTAPVTDTACVPSITIGDILDQIGGQPIDLLKLDIEGSEFDLFSKNAGQWLDRVKVIAIEFHDRFRPGCAHAFYSALAPRSFVQEVCGENILIKLLDANGASS